jgi:hypothetical protein
LLWLLLMNLSDRLLLSAAVVVSVTGQAAPY